MLAFRTMMLVAGAALAVATAPALAGECPSGKVGIDLIPPGPAAPKGVAETVIAAVDLAGQYGAPGKQLRMRRLVVQPGGNLAWHSHAERPGSVYVVSGVITERRSTCAVPIEHRAGEATAEAGQIWHWWKNNTVEPAVLIASDIAAYPQ